MLETGPSPRTWGLRKVGRIAVACRRSIPTHVGFTRMSGPKRFHSPVHPHARGVYVPAVCAQELAAGPSPRTWGLRWSAIADFPQYPVHPHARGVYPGVDNDNPNSRGPSPRTWGLRLWPRLVGKLVRSIPTHVGFTKPASSPSPCWPVHPHARGVYSCGICGTTTRNGPSPRTWGLPGSEFQLSEIRRSIPTHVGFTWSKRTIGVTSPVHPHARGVYVFIETISMEIVGPSPRTWGLRLPPGGNTGDLRSIPTHVGFTVWMELSISA